VVDGASPSNGCYGEKTPRADRKSTHGNLGHKHELKSRKGFLKVLKTIREASTTWSAELEA
jgi:hypothetical protein